MRHRERFDGGLDAAVEASETLSFPLQVHVVHDGGQLFASRVVAVSGRVHRVERFYEYLYRVASIINLRWRIR